MLSLIAERAGAGTSAPPLLRLDVDDPALNDVYPTTTQHESTSALPSMPPPTSPIGTAASAPQLAYGTIAAITTAATAGVCLLALLLGLWLRRLRVCAEAEAREFREKLWSGYEGASGNESRSRMEAGRGSKSRRGKKVRWADVRPRPGGDGRKAEGARRRRRRYERGNVGVRTGDGGVTLHRGESQHLPEQANRRNTIFLGFKRVFPAGEKHHGRYPRDGAGGTSGKTSRTSHQRPIHSHISSAVENENPRSMHTTEYSSGLRRCLESSLVSARERRARRRGRASGPGYGLSRRPSPRPRVVADQRTRVHKERRAQAERRQRAAVAERQQKQRALPSNLSVSAADITDSEDSSSELEPDDSASLHARRKARAREAKETGDGGDGRDNSDGHSISDDQGDILLDNIPSKSGLWHKRRMKSLQEYVDSIEGEPGGRAEVRSQQMLREQEEADMEERAR